jgi:DNA-3-methyladenine glycosylase II
MLERIDVAAPFDFQQMLRRPLSRPSKYAVIDPEELSYTRVLRMGERAVPVTVLGVGSVDAPGLQLVYPDGLTSAEQTALVRRVRHMFSADVDLWPFYAMMATEPEWRGVMQQLYGLRPIQDADLFESMVKVIIGQQLNVQFAATLVDRLVDFGGEERVWMGKSLPVFPSPERVAGWTYESLKQLSFSQRKAEYVIDFARAVVDGQVDLDGVWQMWDDQVYDTLLPLRGIGRWTVECFLLFGAGRPDVMPAADIGVQNAVQKLYGLEHRPSEAEVRHMAQAFAPWRSYATYYLWQSLINVV